MLGIRPTYGGLLVAPCIPSHWDGYRIVRRFRGATYDIEVHNPRQVEHGVASVEVDGKRIEGNLLPLLPLGASGRVVALLG